MRSGLNAVMWMAGLMCAATAQGVEFHVSPKGDDASSGSRWRPFATLPRAQQAAREARKADPQADVRIVVRGRFHELAAPLVLTPADSGTAEHPVVYVARRGEHPILSGGRRLTGFTVDAKGRWVTKVPGVAEGKWAFEQLFVNGERAVRARTPDRGFFRIAKLEQEVEGGDSQPKSRKGSAENVIWTDPTNLAGLATASVEDWKRAVLTVHHNWDHTRRYLTAVDSGAGSLTTTGMPMKPWNPWHKNDLFSIENLETALNAPGEWFLRTDGTLTYIPRPGEDPSTAMVVAPVLTRWLEVKGDPAKAEWVRHVRFEGLTFAHQQWVTPPGGFEPIQASASIGAAMVVDGARDVVFADCEFAHCGEYAVWFRQSCRDCRIERSWLHDIGAGAVRIGETGASAETNLQTGAITVDNNIIHGGGRLFPSAVAVWIAHSADNAVTHNDIGDFFYTGVSVGWVWGYGPSPAKRNRIEFNHVHHLGQGVMSDMGGIYTLGPSEGTRVCNNHFHDVYAYTYGGWGLYTDEGSTGILFENNLVHDVKDGTIHQHYGKENIFRNNILAFSLQRQLALTRIEDHLSLTFSHNIVYWKEGPLLGGPWDKVQIRVVSNCYWNAAGSNVIFAGKSLADWQAKGYDKASLIADPKLRDPGRRDFTVASDSPALRLGFKPFDATQAGVYGDSAWIRRAASVPMPPLPFVEGGPHATVP